MSDNDQDAALAHQQELDRRRQEEEMLGDAEYLKWMNQLYEDEQLRKINEIPRQSIC